MQCRTSGQDTTSFLKHLPSSSSTTYSVHVFFNVAREVEVKNMSNIMHIKATGAKSVATSILTLPKVSTTKGEWEIVE